jgi:hypothetical protein
MRSRLEAIDGGTMQDEHLTGSSRVSKKKPAILLRCRAFLVCGLRVSQ